MSFHLEGIVGTKDLQKGSWIKLKYRVSTYRKLSFIEVLLHWKRRAYKDEFITEWVQVDFVSIFSANYKTYEVRLKRKDGTTKTIIVGESRKFFTYVEEDLGRAEDVGIPQNDLDKFRYL